MEDLVAAFEGKTVAGAFDAVAVPSSTTVLAKAVMQLTEKKALVSVLPQPPDLPEGITFKMAYAVVQPEEIGLAVFRDSLPRALAEGKYLVAPEPLVVGKGLECI